MPKAFSEQEKEIIRRQLRDKGKRLFELRGLRKTSVDEITQAAGISKGAFYLFYPSKEDLFIEIMEQIESELRESVLGQTLRPDEDARENLRRILNGFLLTYDTYPLLKTFREADFDYLLRKLPPERLKEHMDRDSRFFEGLLKKVKREGIAVKVPPRVAMNLVYSLLLVSFHRQDFGEAAYADNIRILTDLVAGYITQGAK